MKLINKMNFCKPVWAAGFRKSFKVSKECNHPFLKRDALDHLFVARQTFP